MGYKYEERLSQDDPLPSHKKLRNKFSITHGQRTATGWSNYIQVMGDITTPTFSPPSLASIAHRNATKKTLMKKTEKTRFTRPRNGLTKKQRKTQKKVKLMVFLSPANGGDCLVASLPMPYTAKDVGKVFSNKVVPWLRKLYPEKSQLLMDCLVSCFLGQLVVKILCLLAE